MHLPLVPSQHVLASMSRAREGFVHVEDSFRQAQMADPVSLARSVSLSVSLSPSLCVSLLCVCVCVCVCLVCVCAPMYVLK